MSELLYKEEAFKIIGLCMEVHRELGKGQDEVIYKDALEVECRRNALPFVRERKYEVEYKGVILPHFYFADFVLFDKILFEGKACERLTDAHVKQVLNYLAVSKLSSVCLLTSARIPWSGNASSLKKGVAARLICKNNPR